ncbi:GDP-L-galactose phosphorylase 1 [Morella rubra]|uniref:GDP-L-galactose phosphorylase 1 n=1 Tax=Morella rubra TaxID=262757 RepID=A0A6A1WD85_9ROSI|nr:GDP-L-galactose phosphorylase 1 [Morella rubra]
MHGEEQSTLDSLFLAQWEDRMWKGVIRYDVTASEIKVICGRRKFLAQFNEGWNVDYVSKPQENRVCSQGDLSFTKWMKHHEELLFCVASGEMTEPELIPSATVPDGAVLITINATPVEYGHVFLVPCGSDSLYQVLDARSLEMVGRVAVEINNSSFCLFYDSPAADTYHQCFQGCYFPSPLPVELTAVNTFFRDGRRGMRISAVTDYPIKTLLFESSQRFKIMVEVLVEICSHLQGRRIPYNLLITNCGQKIFLFLQHQNLANSRTLSAWECGGYFLFRSRAEFDQATEEAIVEKLSAVSLDDEGFQGVKQLCCSIADKLSS